MKILNKYISFTFIKILFSTIALTTLLLICVDLFSNFDSYIQKNISWLNIFILCISLIPQSIILVLPPATLFSVTFLFSQLYASNEIIAFLSSGISLKKIYSKILFVMLLITIFSSIFNENFVLQSKIDREQLRNKLFNINYNFDNTNIGLIDSYNDTIIYANTYIEKDKTLYKVVVLKKDSLNNIIERIDSKTAVWNSNNSDWILYDTIVNSIQGDNVEVKSYEEYEDKSINLEPNLFRNLSSDIQTMLLSSALKYLNIQKKVNLKLWYENMSDFLDRLLKPFSAFLMAIIALSIDYQNKKNVFLFSIFNSVIIAVIYYVVNMVSLIMSKQAIINPFLGVLLPYLVVLFVPFVLNRIKAIPFSRK